MPRPKTKAMLTHHQRVQAGLTQLRADQREAAVKAARVGNKAQRTLRNQ